MDSIIIAENVKTDGKNAIKKHFCDTILSNEEGFIIYIKSPKTNRKIFLDNSLTSYEDRLLQVEERILKNPEIQQYIEDNLTIKNRSQVLSHENAKKILENCATYLLRGQYKENGIMTIFNIRKAQVIEIPVSCVKGNAEDLLYSSSISEEETDVRINASSRLNKYSYKKYDLNEDPKRYDKQTQKLIKKYKNSNTYKLKQLYSTPTIYTYRIKNKNKANVKITTKDNQEYQTIVEYKDKFQDVEYLTIGGYNGLLGLNEKYISDWCLVDTDNIFKFNNSTYQIDKTLKQYEVKCDNKAEMDKILCFYSIDKDKYYFFDENINRIPNDLIHILIK